MMIYGIYFVYLSFAIYWQILEHQLLQV
jgi:hypothetical protein